MAEYPEVAGQAQCQQQEDNEFGTVEQHRSGRPARPCGSAQRGLQLLGTFVQGIHGFLNMTKVMFRKPWMVVS
jgi:hypothetical protein